MLDVVFGVGASERLEPRGTTDDSDDARGQDVLYFEKRLLAVDVKVLRPANPCTTS